MKRFLVALAIGAALLAGCSSGNSSTSGATATTAASGGGKQISVSAIDDEFETKLLSVPAGQTVTATFTNNGQTTHTFTSDDLGFDTGNVDPGASATVTFTAPSGDSGFYCSIHKDSNNMVGTISAK